MVDAYKSGFVPPDLLSEYAQSMAVQAANVVPMVNVIEIRAYNQAAMERDRLINLLERIQKHGLCHFEDCQNASYEDERCTCGMEQLEFEMKNLLTR
jgi:hypothetical protein